MGQFQGLWKPRPSVTWERTVVWTLLVVFVRGGAPHIARVIPLQGDGVHADRGLAAWPLRPRCRRHQMTKGLRRRGLLHLSPFTPRVSLDLSGVFHVRFILRGLLFIFQALKWECPVFRINQIIGCCSCEKHQKSACPTAPESGHYQHFWRSFKKNQVLRPCLWSFQFRLFSVGPRIHIYQNATFFSRKNLKFDNLNNFIWKIRKWRPKFHWWLMVGSSKNQKIKSF